METTKTTEDAGETSREVPRDLERDAAIEKLIPVVDRTDVLVDPAMSYEEPTPTVTDQLTEAALAGLSPASSREVWEQTRAMIMTESFDAVSRDELIEALGPAPDPSEQLLIDDDGQIVATIDVAEKIEQDKRSQNIDEDMGL